MYCSIRVALLFIFLTPLELTLAQEAPPSQEKSQLVLKYGDGKADGKKSIAGTGEMIRFRLSDSSQRVKGLRVHCARYGDPQAPKEDVEISLVRVDDGELIHTELVPYAKFKRGDSRWTTIRFEEPVETSAEFWVILDFNAEQTKGVYVSYDTSTGGEFSQTGVPGGDSRPVSFGGDWMVHVMLTKPE